MGKLPTMRSDRSEILPYNFTSYPVFFGLEKLSDHPNHRMFSHWHEDVEFLVVLEGKMTYSINGIPVTFQAGEGLFVNSQQIHYGFGEPSEDCEFLFALWHPVLLCVTEGIEQSFVSPVLSDEKLTFLHLTKDVPWQREILNRLLSLKDLFRKESAPLLLQSAFFEIWDAIYENALHRTDRRPAVSSQLTTLRSMLSYIHRQFPEKIYLEDIAKAGNISISSCNMIFKKYMNESPVKYLLNYRLQKSCDLLVSTDLPITEVSYRNGFQNLSYFIDSFRKQYGSTPSEYRKLNASKAGLAASLLDSIIFD